MEDNLSVAAYGDDTWEVRERDRKTDQRKWMRDNVVPILRANGRMLAAEVHALTECPFPLTIFGLRARDMSKTFCIDSPAIQAGENHNISTVKIGLHPSMRQ